jgi:hypothetical protein
VLPLDVSILQQPVLYLLSRRTCSTAACGAPGRVLSIVARAAFGRVYLTAAYAASGRTCSTAACAAPGRVFSIADCAAFGRVYLTAACAVSTI